MLRSIQPNRCFHLIAAALFIALTFAPPAAAFWGSDDVVEDTFEQTVDLRSGGEVLVETHNGAIDVRTWDRQEVRIEARKKARSSSESAAQRALDETEIFIEEGSGRVRIEAKTPRSYGRTSVSVHFELTVPRDALLEATSHNGAIDVSELGAAAKLKTHNGAIKARGVGGALVAHTNNGSIKAYEVQGPIDGTTTNGAIEAEILGEMLASDVRLETRNGSVELTLDRGVAATIDARTRNGRVSSDFEGGHQDRRKKTLDLDLNGGGPRIELESTNGGIRIRER